TPRRSRLRRARRIAGCSAEAARTSTRVPGPRRTAWSRRIWTLYGDASPEKRTQSSSAKRMVAWNMGPAPPSRFRAAWSVRGTGAGPRPTVSELPPRDGRVGGARPKERDPRHLGSRDGARVLRHVTKAKAVPRPAEPRRSRRGKRAGLPDQASWSRRFRRG